MKSKIYFRGGWLAGAGTILALCACYGTLGLVALLSMMGVTVAVHEGAWAGTISVFAVLAVGGMALGYRRHGALPPLVLAALGAALIVWVMFGVYHLAVELAGFALLVVATFWDWRVKQKGTAAAS